MSRSNKKQRHIRVVGQPRKEPDVRRIAKAIIALAMDGERADEVADRFDELACTEQAIARRRRAARTSDEDASPEDRAS